MGEISHNLTIDTPENILLDAEIAGFGSRCVAALIDYAIIVIMMLGAAFLFRNAVSPLAAGEDGDGLTPDAILGIYILVQFAIISFYHLFFELIWNGQTPGKRRVGIRVVGANGLPVTATGVIIRNIVRLFDFLPVFYAVGLVVLFGSKTTQRLGDLAARTVVIYERKGLALETVREDLYVTYLYLRRTEPLPPYLQIEALTHEDRRIVVDFLQRRTSLNNRMQVATMLAHKVYRKMEQHQSGNLPSSFSILGAGNQSELFLEQIARAFEVFSEA